MSYGDCDHILLNRNASRYLEFRVRLHICRATVETHQGRTTIADDTK
jgi:hypothetical protein